MSARANGTLVGVFVLAGLALVVGAVLAITGGQLFSRKDTAVMHFNGSIYGLQVGAPVVFRGVPLGSVTAIGMVYDSAADRFTIPVTVELQRDVVRSLDRDGRPSDSALGLPALITKGLSAQLSMQSLLTGQLYVDLDLRPKRTATLRGVAGGAGPVEIPTSATTIQNLKAQLDGMDFRKLLDDVAAIAGSARALATGPELRQSLADLHRITGQVQQLTAKMAAAVDPLARSAQATLADSRRALAQVGSAAQQLGGSANRLGDSAEKMADKVSDTAQRLGHTADRVSALAAPDSALVGSLQRSADELARTATALREQASGDAPLAQHLDQALRDVSQASRAVRELADLLQRQPDALLRGRASPDDQNGAR